MADVLEDRSGDPSEYEEALEGELVDPDDPGDISLPPGLLRQLLVDPSRAPEVLAIRAVEHHSSHAQRDVRLLRERNPGVTDRQLAVHFKRRYSRMARWEGGGTGVIGLVGLPADLAALSWIQHRLVLAIAASYGHDMSDHLDRAAEVLIIQGAHASIDVAQREVIKQTQKAVTRLVLKHLRKDTLALVKQLFKMVGIKFTRKALVEKGIPLIAAPLSATINDASTKLLANRAIKFYDTKVN